jgi:serine/threonine protein kinase
MAADQLASLEPPDKGNEKPEGLPGAAAPAPERGQMAVRWLGASSASGGVPPVLVHKVEAEERAPREPGPAMEQGSNLEPTPEVGTSASVSTVLIPIANGAPLLAAVAADLTRSDDSFDERPVGLGAWVVPPSPATGSILGQIGNITDRPQALPPSVAREGRIPVELPSQFGRYQILEQLGKGAMGAIYLAQDTQLNRRVALKVPHLRGGEDDAAPDQSDLDRFYREASAAATLDHPNLCPVYDVGQIGGIPYLTMAYIKGQPLSTHILRDRPMSQRQAATIVRKLAQALEEAHYNGVVHRDLKPSNIMVNARGDLVIMDFGLAWRIGARNERLTRVGLVMGTPMYMSPEQATGNLETIGPGCDIYSLGVIMHELLTGRVPFEGPEAFVLGQILFVEPPPPSTYRSDLDPQLEAICLKAIAKSLAKRYATMGELAMALGDYVRSAVAAPRLIDARSPEVEQEVDQEGPPQVVPERAAQPAPQAGATAKVEHVDPELAIEVPESGHLWKTWRQWTAIVEHFALRRSHGKVNKITYEKLYKLLVAACRSHAAKAQGPRREFYLRLAEFVLPWMTPRTLESTDRELLYSLLSYCRRFEQDLLDPTALLAEPGDPPAPGAVAELGDVAEPGGVAKTPSGWWLVVGSLVASFVLALIWMYWVS